jgi:SAM-dependent methyltransferase
MALTLTAIRLLARAHAREPFKGPILTLGRQGIIATVAQCEAAIRSQGVRVTPPPAGSDLSPNVPAFQSGPYRGFTNDKGVFGMMCGEIPETLDVSEYEAADHIHDLNEPVPEALKGRFGLIVDGGTLEHVFDVPQALRNIKTMLRPGGRIIHNNPMSNWAEHGYYQFSPTLFHDFYVTNGFELPECLILGYTLTNSESLYSKRAKVWRWNPQRPSAPITSKLMMGSFFEARKTSDCSEHVPQQGEASAASSSQLGGIGSTQMGMLNRIRERALELSPATGGLVHLGKRVLRRDLSSQPWGLQYLGKF